MKEAAFLNLSGSKELYVGFMDHEFAVPNNIVQARNEKWGAFRSLERSAGTDFFRKNALQRKMRRGQSEVLDWDLDMILLPILQIWPGGYLLYDAADSPLPGFRPRTALWHGVRTKRLAMDRALSITTIPAWGNAGLERLVEDLIRGTVPVVDAARTRILVGALPSSVGSVKHLILSEIQAEVQLQGSRSQVEEMAESLLEDFGRQFEEDADVAKILDEIALLGKKLGIDFDPRCRASKFLSAILEGPKDGTLILVAHQDDDGVHFHDGTVNIDEVRLLLRDNVGKSTLGQLYVCGLYGVGAP